jgi:hypothetical protein
LVNQFVLFLSSDIYLLLFVCSSSFCLSHLTQLESVSYVYNFLGFGFGFGLLIVVESRNHIPKSGRAVVRRLK